MSTSEGVMTDERKATDSVAAAFAEIGRLLRMRGRRLDRDALESRHVYVRKTIGQCRHTRRNNLRVAYADNRRAALIERLAKAGRHDDLRALKPTPDEWKRVRELRDAA